MPVTMTLSEDGYTLCFNISNPITVEELKNTDPDMIRIFESSSHKMDVVVDATNLKSLPSGTLQLRNSPIIQHGNSGNLAIVGANPLARNLAQTIFRLANYKRAHFFNSAGEAITYFQTQRNSS